MCCFLSFDNLVTVFGCFIVLQVLINQKVEVVLACLIVTNFLQPFFGFFTIFGTSEIFGSLFLITIHSVLKLQQDQVLFSIFAANNSKSFFDSPQSLIAILFSKNYLLIIIFEYNFLKIFQCQFFKTFSIFKRYIITYCKNKKIKFYRL